MEIKRNKDRKTWKKKLMTCICDSKFSFNNEIFFFFFYNYSVLVAKCNIIFKEILITFLSYLGKSITENPLVLLYTRRIFTRALFATYVINK